MIPASLGDLSQSFQLRRDTTRIKADLNRLTHELSSGVAENITAHLKGNFGPLSGIERGLARMDSFKTVIAEQSLVITTFQSTFTNMRALGEDLRGALITVPDTVNPTLVRNAGKDALARMNSVINGLNGQAGGATIFAGVDTDGPAVADLDTIMSALEAEITISGATTTADVEMIVGNWFAVGGGFDTIGYVGGAAMDQGAQLSDRESLPPLITAQSEEVRSFLGAMALGGLLGRDLFLGNPDEQGALARLAGEKLFDADSRLVDLQSSIGLMEAQLERASVEVATESDSLTFARSELIEIDPYEAAVNLQNAETQLQTLYSITARLSRLSLTQYL